jgi:hypothetical protein
MKEHDSDIGHCVNGDILKNVFGGLYQAEKINALMTKKGFGCVHHEPK